MQINDPIESLIIRNIPTLKPEESVNQVVHLIRNSKVHSVVIVDNNGGFLGIVTEGMIARGYVNINTKINQLMRSVPTLEPSTSIISAVEIALQSGSRILPVCDNQNFIGVIPADNMISILRSPDYRSTRIREIMTKNPVTITPDTSVAQAMAIARDQGISRLLVVRKGQLEGIVALHDIIEKVLYSSHRSLRPEATEVVTKPFRTPVKTIMVSDVVTAEADLPVPEAIGRMMDRHVASIVVIEKKKVVGIVTRLDFLEFIASQKVKTVSPMVIQVSYRTQQVNPFEKEQIVSFLGRFRDQFVRTLGESYLAIHFKQLHVHETDNPLILCRGRLVADLGQFVVVAESHGWLPALQIAMSALERQVLSKKDQVDDQKQVERFIDKTLRVWD